MDELRAQNARVLRLSLAAGGAGSLLALPFGPKAALGVLTGALMCLAGYYLIVRWSAVMTNGMADYCLRYAFYGIVVTAAFLAGLPVLALLAGITLQKGATALSSLNGKERDRGFNQRH